uniref:Uncharacterized protein, contains caspase domain n=1 Tax=Candidatus Kentrum sp. MB TaxID=2138164 RepID=A0A450XEG8_9GAMM|nr:MAG: Uncharacterized protein, contains caspase domain [Candidatus Kentron sp. MB]VFK33055.1 MAG: Uncharacterized protein, contains caspase domain [Candidatus Kentron sp. MB]VFK75713.1 MAG: Uncharacterized protein, contains caspase domain [Candidatus Kentron sp. MB]
MGKHALLIGVSQYPEGALRPLPAALPDARALRSVLINPNMGGFPRDNVTLLENPDRVDMESAIERLFADRERDDLTLLYFSGHGIKDDTSQLYFATFETRKYTNGALIRATAVPAAVVRDNMERSRARRQVIILDSCFSGAFPEGLSIKDDGSLPIREQLGGKGRAILTAATASRYAFEKENENLSLYTRFLVRGIETGEADKDEDGVVTPEELHEYARRKARELQPAMQPGLYLDDDGDTIHLARVPIPDPKARYAKAVADALDRRGEITMAGRANLDHWRERLALSAAQYDTIEREISVKCRAAFQEMANEYAALVRAILETGKALKSEAAQLDQRREALKLEPEDAREIEANVEKEVTEKQAQHDKDRQMYAASLREAMRLEGNKFTETTRTRLARLQKEFALSDVEVAEIREKVRKEKKLPSRWGWTRKLVWDTGNSMVHIIAAIVTIIVGALTIVSLFSSTDKGTGDRSAPSQTTYEPLSQFILSHGQLIIRSNQFGDTVTINGNQVGASGPKPHKLPAGEYTVRVEKAGFVSFETRITLAAGQRETVFATLKRRVPVFGGR